MEDYIIRTDNSQPTMNNLYVVRAKSENSTPMTKEEAMQKAKEYEQNGVMAYVITEEAARQLEQKNVNASMWI